MRGEDGDQVGRGRQVGDEVDRLTRPHGLRGQVAARDAVLVGLPGGGVGSQFVFTVPPLVKERVTEGAAGVLPWPPGTAGDIEHAAALGVRAVPVDDRLDGRRIGERLGRREEPGSQQHPGGAECEGRRHASPVGDPAGGQHRDRRGQVRHDGHERQGRPAAPGAVPAAFRALRHDHVGAEVDRLPGLIHAGRLDDQGRAGPADGVRERAGVAEGQHDRPGPPLQRALDRADVDCPALEADAPRFAGAPGDDRQFAGQPVRISVAAAEQPQPAAAGHRRREGSAGRPAHRRQRDRVPHGEQLGERREQCHSPIVTPGSVIEGHKRRALTSSAWPTGFFATAWLLA